MEEASADVQARVRASFERQGLMDHLGARIAHIGPGRTLTVCNLDVYASRSTDRTLIASGQQTLIQIQSRPER